MHGVPVVVASQLPLTMAGSVVLTESFYRPLLSGQDVRAALHEARVSLREAEKTRYDWVGLVGYVSLPEGYADHLMEVGLKCELAMLNTARKKAEAVLEQGADASQLEPIEELVRDRIAALTSRRETLPRELTALRAECSGLLASAYKRLSELQFRRGVGSGPRDRELLVESRRNLEESLQHYKEEYESNLSHHWTGVQRLALDGVLTGGIGEPEWTAVGLAAKFALAGPAPDCWAYGTLAELQLLARLAGKERRLDEASEALQQLKNAHLEYGVESTRYQLDKYVSWWTKENGFFGGEEDLSDDARELLKVLA